MKFNRFASFAILAGAMALPAMAQEAAPVCPVDADVQAYQASEALESVTRQEDLNREVSKAVGLANACADQPFVQYFTARSYFYTLRKLADPNGQFQYLVAATNALRAYDMTAPEDRIWAPDLKAKDGSSLTIDTLSGAKAMLATGLVPLVVRFEAGGAFHPFISSESRKPGTPCPWTTPDLAVAEAAGYPEGFHEIGMYYYENMAVPNINGAAERIAFLQVACPAAMKGLTSNLAWLFADTARGAESIGKIEAAAAYAEDAKAEYQSFRVIAEADGDDEVRLERTDGQIREMQNLIDQAAE